MIAEAVDLSSGTLSIVVVCTLLGVAALAGAGYTRIITRLDQLTESIRSMAKRADKHEEAAADHRHEDAARFQEHELRVSRLEHHAELTPITELRPPTGPHRHLRGRPPRPPSDTDAGESR